ncbi:MAG: hypothetical protein J1E16_11485 [Muribaculaceae bacterium]|nr:hypothetical protein [Muribaculaceae bacterium]
MIESGIIEMPSKKMFSILFMQNGILWFLIALIGILVFSLIGIFIDNRFFIVALIWLFLIFPMIVAFLYFFYGMKPLTAFNTIPHSLKFYDHKITVQFFKETEKGLTYDPNKDYNIDAKYFEKMKTGSDYVLLFFYKLGWIWLPVTGFDSLSEMQQSINYIKSLKE